MSTGGVCWWVSKSSLLTAVTAYLRTLNNLKRSHNLTLILYTKSCVLSSVQRGLPKKYKESIILMIHSLYHFCHWLARWFVIVKKGFIFFFGKSAIQVVTIILAFFIILWQSEWFDAIKLTKKWQSLRAIKLSLSPQQHT